ncbi:MAG: NADH-quinone oxidoreductase subunit J [Flammeovirgaceae bacterium]|jgi:NADH:ubiquinone oxidoreductase subunit 6 (subunit J)|nr:NADH-quinone oxidoreductase subunit J [Flammeovirgaceae bacterium]|tara:strand:- start:14277 stop:14771 length:495 start_codon:yes stop_codon:yes gene_type:complete
MIELLTYVFGALIVVSGLALVFTNNLIHAAFLLAFCLLNVAGFYVIHHANFLAIVQILIYAGGILILLAFGIMLTNRSENGKVLTKNHLLFFGLLCAVGMAMMLYALITNPKTGTIEAIQSVEQVTQIGMRLLTQYILAFELIAFLLLVVLVGAAFTGKKSYDA